MAIVDATIVESTARSRCQIEIVAENRAEGEAQHFPTLVADCTARRLLADKGLSSRGGGPVGDHVPGRPGPWKRRQP